MDENDENPNEWDLFELQSINRQQNTINKLCILDYLLDECGFRKVQYDPSNVMSIEEHGLEWRYSGTKYVPLNASVGERL